MSITYRLKLFLGYNKNKLDIEIHKKNSEKIITNYLQKSTEKKNANRSSRFFYPRLAKCRHSS